MTAPDYWGSSMRTFALIAAGLVALAAPAHAARTMTAANNATGNSIQPFGPAPAATPTYGQVFASPISGNLDAFTFWLGGNVGKIRGVIGTWNGSYNYAECGGTQTNCGSPTTLWDSGLVDVAAAGAVTFNPNIRLLDLTKYVAYISVYGNGDAAGSTTVELGDGSSDYLRYFVWNDGTSDPRGNGTWNYYQDVGDARFSFTVSNVPEPAEWALFITGFGLLGAVARRRRSGLACPA
jgi:hypothetical protein